MDIHTNKDNQLNMNGVWKRITVLTVCFFLVMAALVLYVSKTRVITIEQISQDEVQSKKHADEAPIHGDGNEKGESFASEMTNVNEHSETGIDLTKEKQELLFMKGVHTDYLCIPLPIECKAEHISIENHYMDRELCVKIQTSKPYFYVDNAISGNYSAIRAGEFVMNEDSVELFFSLDGVYEYHSVLENGALYISFQNPREIYSRIVVIDPARGGADLGLAANELQEKDIVLEVAECLKKKMDQTDVKVYYTRMDDVNPDNMERIALANDIKADMYIRIETDVLEDTGIYGVTAVYNNEYFIPGFGSVELADLLIKEVVTAVNGKALGLRVYEEKDITVQEATVPASIIRVGCLSNKQEAILLSKEEYIEKIAEGIFQAIMKAYEE